MCKFSTFELDCTRKQLTSLDNVTQFTYFDLKAAKRGFEINPINC